MAADLPCLAQQIAHFESRLQADPASRVFLALADLYRRAGDLARAREVLVTGLAAHSGFTSARVALGEVLMGLGELPAARQELQAVLARDKDNVLALRLLARDAAAHQDWPVACELAERQLRLQPEDAEVRATLRRARGALAGRSERPAPENPEKLEQPETPEKPEKLEKLEKTEKVAATPGAGFETPTLADLYRRQGHPEKARAILERILRAEPGRADALEALARLYCQDQESADAERPPASAGRERGPDAGDAAVADQAAGGVRSPDRAGTAALAANGAGRAEDLDRFRAWLDRSAGPRDAGC